MTTRNMLLWHQGEWYDAVSETRWKSPWPHRGVPEAIAARMVSDFAGAELPAILNAFGDYDGPPPELRATGTHIQWRVEGSETWVDLIALTAIQGEGVSLRREGENLEWRAGEGEWQTLVPLADITGPSAYDIAVAEGFVGDEAAWLASLIGPQGSLADAFKGDWNSATAYGLGEVVYRNGSSWYALRANTNKEPGSNPDDWRLFAAKGLDGSGAVSSVAGKTGSVTLVPGDVAGLTGLLDGAANYFNLLKDGGRFAGSPESTVRQISAYVAPSYIVAFNGAAITQGPKYIDNNTTYGGSAGALDPDIDAIISKVKQESIRRFGVEFFALNITAGTGTAAGTLTVDSVPHYYAFTTPTAPIPDIFSKNYWVLVKSGSVALQFGGTNWTIYVDGVPITANTRIVPADGPKQITVHLTRSAATFPGYDNVIHKLFASVSANFLLAMPAVVPGHLPMAAGRYYGVIPSLETLRGPEGDVISQAEAETGTSTQVRLFNALRSRQTANAAIAAQKGQNSGLASLDSGGKVPLTQLPAGIGGGETLLTANATLTDAVAPPGQLIRVKAAAAIGGRITLTVPDARPQGWRRTILVSDGVAELALGSNTLTVNGEALPGGSTPVITAGKRTMLIADTAGNLVRY
ncbi:MAG: hypothetical protein ACQRW7_02980 [Caulobacterales bacterium]|uniref:hypothetical protein n=1 Tax=Glycocaulis sp. TaxID=1969725 RepID=UPI003F9F7E2D